MGDLELNTLQKAEAIVDELYEYRDLYIELNGIENSSKKNADVTSKVNSTLAQLNDLKVDLDKAVYFYLRGKTLNVTQTFDTQAEECLSKAVKLDPNLIEAWNQLGESYWKSHKIDSAFNCFNRAIEKKKNKVSLRNLSMVQRQLTGDYDKKLTNIRLSVNTAKEAVAMDLSDGYSWFVLGNAFLSAFFFTGQSPTDLKQCMSAYKRAENDKKSVHNPDLHYNRAVAYRYQEDFTKALAGFKQAMLLDPSWKSPQEDFKDLVKILKSCDDMIKNKGRLKAKKLSKIVNQIKESDLGPFLDGEYTSPLNSKITLKCALINDLHTNCNENIVIHGKVVAVIPVKDGVPFVFVLIDKNCNCISVSVFNLAGDKAMILGDSVAIPEPFVQRNEINLYGEKIDFNNIRVDNPVILVVNRRKVGKERLAFSVLSVSNKSE